MVAHHRSPTAAVRPVSIVLTTDLKTNLARLDFQRKVLQHGRVGAHRVTKCDVLEAHSALWSKSKQTSETTCTSHLHATSEKSAETLTQNECKNVNHDLIGTIERNQYTTHWQALIKYGGGQICRFTSQVSGTRPPETGISGTRSVTSNIRAPAPTAFITSAYTPDICKVTRVRQDRKTFGKDQRG